MKLKKGMLIRTESNALCLVTKVSNTVNIWALDDDSLSRHC